MDLVESVKRIFVIVLLSIVPFYSFSQSIDVTKLTEGELLSATWEGEPVYVYKRTPAQIETLRSKLFQGMDLNALAPAIERVAMSTSNERASQILHFLLKLEDRPTRSIRKDILVISASSSGLGCRIEHISEDESLTDPCSGSVYGLDGRIEQANEREPYHLLIPPHYYLDENMLIIGSDPEEQVKIYDFSPNIIMMKGSSAEKLIHAIQWKKKSIALILLKNKEVVNYTNHHFSTALHVAAARGDTHLINEMISAGFDVNHINNGNITPLQVAVMANHEQNIATLIKSGAKREAFCKLDRCTESVEDFMVNYALVQNSEEAKKYLDHAMNKNYRN